VGKREKEQGISTTKGTKNTKSTMKKLEISSTKGTKRLLYGPFPGRAWERDYINGILKCHDATTIYAMQFQDTLG
jgi:hypothetical protein